jgi:hypothetical protein
MSHIDSNIGQANQDNQQINRRGTHSHEENQAHIGMQS